MASSPALRPHWPALAPTPDAEPLASLRLVPGLDDGAAAPVAALPTGRLRLTGTDEQLAARVAPEGQAPFAALYERHRADLQRYCLSVVRDRDDAADAANEAWLRAFAALSSPRMRPISFRAWLYSIARNACTDRLRERGRFSLQELSDDDLGGADSSAELHEMRETVRELLGDLAVLSERQRSAISLREVAGLSLDEIAVALETTPPKVMTLVAEARRVLHERQAGRRLPCDAVRRRIETLHVKSHRIRAHLDDCALCSAHHARTRAHRLSSLALLPLALVRPALDRTLRLLKHHFAFGSLSSKLVATGTIAVLAGAGAAVAVHGAGHRNARPHVGSPRSVARYAAHASRASARRGARALGPAAPGAKPASKVRPRVASSPSPPPRPAATPHASATATTESVAPAATPARPLAALHSTVQTLTKPASQLLEVGRNTTAAVQQTAKTLTTSLVQTSVAPRIKTPPPSVP